jgi:hypothetical protein
MLEKQFFSAFENTLPPSDKSSDHPFSLLSIDFSNLWPYY